MEGRAGEGAPHQRRRRLAVCGTVLLALTGVLVLVSAFTILESSAKGHKCSHGTLGGEVDGGEVGCGISGNHQARSASLAVPDNLRSVPQAFIAVPRLGLGGGEGWRGAAAAELEGEGVNDAASGAGGSEMVSVQDYSQVLAKITKRLAKDTAKIDSLETKVDDAEETNEELSAKYKAILTAKVRRGEGPEHFLPRQPSPSRGLEKYGSAGNSADPPTPKPPSCCHFGVSLVDFGLTGPFAAKQGRGVCRAPQDSTGRGGRGESLGHLASMGRGGRGESPACRGRDLQVHAAETERPERGD